MSLKLAGFIKVGIGIFLSPLLGILIGYLFTLFLTRLSKGKRKKQRNKFFKHAQLFSSALLSLTHGSNDAQKTMGIIAILLFSSSWIHGAFYVPFWVVVSCQAVISLGTLAGGWRIVHTMGTQITTLNTLKGCAAETGAALTIFVATEFGIPVSTTHTVTGAIAGVGLSNGIHGAHWKVLRRIFFSWLLTIPAAGMVAAAIILSY